MYTEVNDCPLMTQSGADAGLVPLGLNHSAPFLVPCAMCRAYRGQPVRLGQASPVHVPG